MKESERYKSDGHDPRFTLLAKFDDGTAIEIENIGRKQITFK